MEECFIVPKVSVIIPVYNVEKYLAECLDSVINQTEKDIEIICIDDCSTDSSLNILQEYAKNDNRIVILQNEQNSGQSVARNKGLEIAKGEYVLFVDSDDFIEPNLLEIALKYVNDVDIVCFDYREYNPDKLGSFTHNYTFDNRLYSGEEYFFEATKTYSIIVITCNKLYRKNFLLENNIRFVPGLLYEDFLFYFYCVLKAKNIRCIDDKLYIYRIRPESTMTKKLNPKNVDDTFYSLWKATKEYLENDFSPKMSVSIERFLRFVGYSYIRRYKQLVSHVNDTEKIEELTQYRKLQNIYAPLMANIATRINFTDEQIYRIKTAENVIVYGAGDFAREVINYLDEKDIFIKGIAVSNIQNSKRSLLGNPIKDITDFINLKDNCIVIIAATSTYGKEIKIHLEKLGFTNYLVLFSE